MLLCVGVGVGTGVEVPVLVTEVILPVLSGGMFPETQ
jgi:hypothetical protein